MKGPDGGTPNPGGPPVVPVDQDPPVTMTYQDFPAMPVIDMGLPAGLPGQFGSGGAQSGGPCLTEPPIDALFPKNWTPPVFEWSAPGGMNVFELRVHVANQGQDLVVYTSQTRYVMDTATWTALANHSAGFNMTITLRGGSLMGGNLSGAPATGSAGNVHIAPAVAPGAVVYWTTSGGTALKGFHIGDAAVTTLVTPQLMSDGTGCVGCHALAPDGKLVFLSRNVNMDDPFNLEARTVDGKAATASLADVSQNARTLLARGDQTLPTFSPAHYSAGDAVVLTELASPDRFEIAWTDLHAMSGGTGVIKRQGDSRQAASPTWSNDGNTIAYTSTDQVTDGRPRKALADIYTVPYNNHQGGQATPLPGASEAAYSEYYPAYSPDDRLLAFDRVAAGTNMYNEPTAELFVVPAQGGTATRLRSNDPAQCSGVKSPGVTNSWPRWAPSATQVGGKHYYWLVFSSTRRDPKHPQLYIAAVVTQDQAGGPVVWKTYPAVYLSSQEPTESNHTPAWGEFVIP